MITRVATLTKRSRKKFDKLKKVHRAITERLVTNYKPRSARSAG